MICSSCGFPVEGKFHGPYEGKRYICENCWNNPALFFPDKAQKTLGAFCSSDEQGRSDFASIIELIDLFRGSQGLSTTELDETWSEAFDASIKINVLKVNQKNLPLFIGKVKASELLLFSVSDQWNDESLQGYQREKFDAKTKEIKKYLLDCPISIVPAIFASYKEGHFSPSSDTNGDFGILNIPIKPNALSIIDGQQRIGGFEEIFKEIKALRGKTRIENREELFQSYADLLSSEIPIVLVDSQAIVDRMNEEIPNGKIKASDLDAAFFYIINKTQKPVNPSLKDELAYNTVRSGIVGIPSIEKEIWRTEVVPIANELNLPSSPLHNLINLGGALNNGKSIPLYSFVSSLKPLWENPNFSLLGTPAKVEYLQNYWTCIRETFPDAFERKSDYLLLRVVSIYALNYLSENVFRWCSTRGCDPLNIESIMKYIAALGEFDWDKKTSPIAYLGGGKGVRKAQEVILNVMSDKGVEEAKEELNLRNPP